jgi:hypothetical protein
LIQGHPAVRDLGKGAIRRPAPPPTLSALRVTEGFGDGNPKYGATHCQDP